MLNQSEFQALQLLSFQNITIKDLILHAMHGYTANNDTTMNQEKSDLCRLALKYFQNN